MWGGAATSKGRDAWIVRFIRLLCGLMTLEERPRQRVCSLLYSCLIDLPETAVIQPCGPRGASLSASRAMEFRRGIGFLRSPLALRGSAGNRRILGDAAPRERVSLGPLCHERCNSATASLALVRAHARAGRGALSENGYSKCPAWRVWTRSRANGAVSR